MKPIGKLFVSVALAVPFLTAECLGAQMAVTGVEHVIIIGCDGMSPDGVQKAETPNTRRLMREGAFNLHARGVMPTVSSPNWASMIMGAGPEQHGVTSNEWETNK